MAIDAETIGAAIAERGWRLSFPTEIEAYFEADTNELRCKRVIRHNFVGITIYNAFLLGDWLLIRDIFAFSVCLHLFVMTPIMGLVILAMKRKPAPWLRESILAGGIILATMAILGLMLLSHSPLRTSEHISVVLVILFATMVQRIRFPFVLVAGLVSLALYTGALGIFVSHDLARATVAIAVFTGVVLFSLIGSYNLEYEQRMSYLLALRDRLRHEDLERVSLRDALTGLGNRRALDQALARLQNNGRCSPVAVLIFDVDYFKAYNDDKGHLEGDACLRKIADIIAGDQRLSPQTVFRFGGEEFLAIVEDCAAAEAEAVGERIRSAVEGAEIRCGHGNAGSVTISVGIQIARGDLTDAIANADCALYAAKRLGRNRVQFFDSTLDGASQARAAA